MAGPINSPGAKGSFLDRLAQRSEPVSAGQSLRDYRDSVVRDLSNLLNTRATLQYAAAGLENLERSLALYGLPDISALNPKSPDDRTALRRALVDVIRQFEPRLINVKVESVESKEVLPRLRFRITASLHADPRPIDISLDTVFEGDTRRVVVRADE